MSTDCLVRVLNSHNKVFPKHWGFTHLSNCRLILSHRYVLYLAFYLFYRSSFFFFESLRTWGIQNFSSVEKVFPQKSWIPSLSFSSKTRPQSWRLDLICYGLDTGVTRRRAWAQEDGPIIWDCTCHVWTYFVPQSTFTRTPQEIPGLPIRYICGEGRTDGWKWIC